MDSGAWPRAGGVGRRADVEHPMLRALSAHAAKACAENLSGLVCLFFLVVFVLILHTRKAHNCNITNSAKSSTRSPDAEV